MVRSEQLHLIVCFPTVWLWGGLKMPLPSPTVYFPIPSSLPFRAGVNERGWEGCGLYPRWFLSPEYQNEKWILSRWKSITVKKPPLHDQSFKASDSKGKSWENRCGNTEARIEITVLWELIRRTLIKISAINIYTYIYICHRAWKIYSWNGGTRCYNLTESTEPSKAWRMVDHFPQILSDVLFESHKILNLLEKKSHEVYVHDGRKVSPPKICFGEK